MFNLERWEEIFEAISKNKLRTFLTGLSIGSGVLILILLLGISNGMKNGIKKEFEKGKEFVNDLKKKVRDSRNFSNTTTKDLESIIFSLNDNFSTVIEICIENIKDFKDSLCAFG